MAGGNSTSTDNGKSKSSSDKRSSSPASPKTRKQSPKKSKWCCGRYHLNSSWSVWYALIVTSVTGYLVHQGVRRFLLYASLSWPEDEQPFVELNAHVGCVGAAVAVLPFFLASAVLKVGNLANDGFKLGDNLATCSRDPPSVLEYSPGFIRNLWLHGLPTAAFLHLVAAFCLLLPKVLMDASLINAGFLPRGDVWKTDLDILVPYNERVLVTGLRPIHNSSHVSFSVNESTTTFAPLEPPPLPPSGETGGRKRKKTSNREDRRKDKSSLPRTAAFVQLPEDLQWRPFSLELLNYASALIVFAVRYPAVFWHTNKCLSLLFSFQLMINGVQTILSFTAFTILYKLHINGDSNELHGGEAFLLNLPITLTLFTVTLVVITASSSAIYLYGYQKFASFLVKSRKRFHISYDKMPAVMRPYGPHCTSLVILVALGVTQGPLLWDLTMVYRGSLDAVVLAAVVGSIVHLFMWIVLWLVLTVKTSWTFKLRVTLSRACVSAAHSIKLVNDVELAPGDAQANMPLLVVGGGKAYAVADQAPRKAIMSVVQKTHEEKRSKGQEGEIYWLRPSPHLIQENTKSSEPISSPRPKVKFEDTEMAGKHAGIRSPRLKKSSFQRGGILSDSEEEAGDYAFLRDISSIHRPLTQQEKDPRYVDRQQILAYRQTMSRNPTQILNSESKVSNSVQHIEVHGLITPMSNDSGVIQEDRSQQSDLSSTDSSHTPPENSEESGVLLGTVDVLRNRSNSMDGLNQLPPDAHLPMPRRSLSLQRTAANPHGWPKPPVAPGTVVYPAAESTVVIRRQRNLTREIQPPVDPIYGSRSLSSFVDLDQRKKTTNEDQSADAQNSFNNSQSFANSPGCGYSYANSNSSGYSSGSSPGPAVMMQSPPFSQINLESQRNPVYSQNLYGQTVQSPPLMNYDIYNHNAAIPSASPKLPQAPQIPLPPIPQGILRNHEPAINHESRLGALSDHRIRPSSPDLGQRHSHDIYGRTTGHKIYGQLPVNPHGIYNPSMRPSVGRSSSLRSTSTLHSGVAKLPHLLPRESHYNTNV